jgi:hypothetical protein
MRLVPTALVSAVLLLLPAFSSAQSLGEVAAREREKRKNAKPTKIYTERDLRGAGAGAPVNIGTGEVSTGEPAAQTPSEGAAPGGAAPGAAKPGQKEKTEDEVRAEQTKAWREQLDKANAEVTRLTGELAKLEAVAGDARTPIYGTNRDLLMTRIDELRKQLAAAQQSVDTLTEQGRRQGFR